MRIISGPARRGGIFGCFRSRQAGALSRDGNWRRSDDDFMKRAWVSGPVFVGVAVLTDGGLYYYGSPQPRLDPPNALVISSANKDMRDIANAVGVYPIATGVDGRKIN